MCSRVGNGTASPYITCRPGRPARRWNEGFRRSRMSARQPPSRLDESCAAGDSGDAHAGPDDRPTATARSRRTPELSFGPVGCEQQQRDQGNATQANNKAHHLANAVPVGCTRGRTSVNSTQLRIHLRLAPRRSADMRHFVERLGSPSSGCRACTAVLRVAILLHRAGQPRRPSGDKDAPADDMTTFDQGDT